MRVMLYSCLFGGYDSLLPAPAIPGVETYLITEGKFDDLKGWTLLPVSVPAGLGPKKASRYFKILPWSVPKLKEADITIYVDANLEIVNPALLIEKANVPHVGLTKHPDRKTVSEEVAACIKMNKDKKETLLKEAAKFQKIGFDNRAGLWQCGLIFRNMKSYPANELCRHWWDYVKEFSHRDQISLPVALWEIGFPQRITTYPADALTSITRKHKHGKH